MRFGDKVDCRLLREVGKILIILRTATRNATDTSVQCFRKIFTRRVDKGLLLVSP